MAGTFLLALIPVFSSCSGDGDTGGKPTARLTITNSSGTKTYNATAVDQTNIFTVNELYTRTIVMALVENNEPLSFTITVGLDVPPTGTISMGAYWGGDSKFISVMGATGIFDSYSTVYTQSGTITINAWGANNKDKTHLTFNGTFVSSGSNPETFTISGEFNLN